MDAGWYGSASTMIAASLQLSGEYAQAKILDAISFTNLKYLAVAIYILGFIGALISAALWQNYRIAIWLVLGPALWDIMTYTRQPTFDVRWEYAGTTRATETDIAKYSEADKFTPPTKGPSTFFKLWDEIVSSSVQTVNKTIADLANDPATQLFARNAFQQSLFGSAIHNPDLRQAIAIAISPTCTVEVQRPSSKPPKEWSSTQRETYDDDITSALRDRVLINVPAPVIASLCSYKLTYDAWLTNPYGPQPDDAVISDACLTTPDWRSIGDGSEDVPPNNCHTLSSTVWKSMVVEAEKLRRASLTQNGSKEDGIGRENQNLIPQWQRLIDGSTPLGTAGAGAPREALAFQSVVASYLLKNTIPTLQYTLPSMRAVDVTSTERGLLSSTENNTDAVSYRLGAGAATWASYFIRSMPYLQGSILYVLAFLFPFMVIASLLPGFGRAVVTWMGCWAWVKSWDVGKYIVSLISGVLSENLIQRDLVSQYVVDSGTATSERIGGAIYDTFKEINVIQEALVLTLPELNPVFSSGLIDYISGLLLILVPALTGAIFLIGRGAALSAISGNFLSKADQSHDIGLNTNLDELNRKFGVALQNQQIQSSALGATVGGLAGYVIGGPYAGLVGTTMGYIHNKSLESLRQGQEYRPIASRFLNTQNALPTGNVIDPVEALVAIWGTQAASNFMDVQIGIPAGGGYPEVIGSRSWHRMSLPGDPYSVHLSRGMLRK